MPYCRQRWKHSVKPKEGGDSAERARKAAQRARQGTVSRLPCLRGTTLTSIQLLLSRHVVCRRRGFERHYWIFSVLEAAHMSGDETDGPKKKHPPVFRIIIANWQSQELINFLRMLDAMYREDWENPKHRRAMGGNPPRVRVMPPPGEGGKVSGLAPVGLPRNFYNREWLDSLPAYARKELEIIDEDYDFSI
ncbi:hypothetical protein GY45DRAFT_1262515 [Cubamyces sp. BRFM 1775]|nr:hypothetical protein GY45DRAFT_1262515 [Cubamyces sp. BRFM 1775]